MPTDLDNAKRDLIKLLQELARRHNLVLAVSRDSTDKEVLKAFKKVALKAHPDKGGRQQDFQRLSAAKDKWEDFLKNKRPAGRPRAADEDNKRKERPKTGKSFTIAVPPDAKKEYRITSQAVLLTYQGFSKDRRVVLLAWGRFVKFFEDNVREWGVRHWSATARHAVRRRRQVVQELIPWKNSWTTLRSSEGQRVLRYGGPSVLVQT